MPSIEKLDSALIQQEKIPYTMHHNYVLQNVRDTTVLAIWCYLTSLPDNWKVHRTQLMSHFNIGRDKLSKALKFLHDNHLLEYIQERSENGVFGENYIKIKCGTDFEVHHKLSTNEHFTAPLKIRATEKPDNGKTAPTKEIKIYKENKEQKKEVFVLPEWVDQGDWDNFKEHRQQLKKPMTLNAEKLAIQKLHKLKLSGYIVRDIINESIINGWAGLFEPKKVYYEAHRKPEIRSTVQWATDNH